MQPLAMIHGIVPAILVAAVGTWLVRALARRLNIVNQPNPIVRQHTRPAAYLGGVGVGLGIAGGLVLAALVPASTSTQVPSDDRTGQVLAITSLLFLVLGIGDDIWPFAPGHKFLLQGAISCLPVACNLVAPLTGNLVLDTGLSWLWIVTVVNAFNFTDVCDGLLACLSVVMFTLLACQQPGHGNLALVVAGACLGFLVFNRPPATIFLGDAGSHLLGSLAAMLAILATREASATPWITGGRALLVLSVPLFELVFITIVRISKGLPWWKGSPDHFSLRLQAAGLSRLQTDVLAGAVALAVGTIGLVGSPIVGTLLPTLAGAFWFYFSVGRVLLRFEAAQKPRLVSAPISSPTTASEDALAEPDLLTSPETEVRRPCRTTGAMTRHVLFIHQNFVSARQGGNTRPVHLLEAFRRRGFHVDVVTTIQGYLNDAQPSVPRHPIVERDEGQIVHRLPLDMSESYVTARSQSYLQFLCRATRYVRQIPLVDVLYCSTPPLPQVLLPLWLSWRRGIPLVLEVRDLWPSFLTELGTLRSRPLVWAMELIEALIYAYADRCIVVAPAFKEYLVGMGVPADRIAIAVTGADPAYRAVQHVESERWRRDHGLSGKFMVLYSGSLNKPYGIEHVIQAAIALAPTRPDIHWVFIGNGRDREIIQRTANALRTVHLFDLLPKPALVPIQKTADLGLVSLVVSNLMKTVVPGKLFDYLAAGVPVLSTIDGQTGAILRAAAAGWVCETSSPAQLAGQVAAIANLPSDQRQAMGYAGQEWINRHASATQMADHVVELVAATLGRNQPSRLRQCWRLARALFGATDAVVRRRSARVGRKLFGDDVERTVQQSFTRWLREGLGETAVAGAEASKVIEHSFQTKDTPCP